MADKPRCGVKYVNRRINGRPLYSYCSKRPNHWGRHGKRGLFG